MRINHVSRARTLHAGVGFLGQAPAPTNCSNVDYLMPRLSAPAQRLNLRLSGYYLSLLRCYMYLLRARLHQKGFIVY